MKPLIFLVAWCILLVLSWPVALITLLALPFVLLLWLPLRLIWICIHAGFALVQAILLLPARLLGYRNRS